MDERLKPGIHAKSACDPKFAGFEKGMVINMRQIKNRLLLGLILICILALTGCKQASDDNRTEDKNTTITPAEKENEGSGNQQKSDEPVQEKEKEKEQEELMIHKPTAADIVNDIILGWNLGNTLDAYANNVKGLKTETCWGNPVTSKEMIDMVKEAGFNSVRVPVTWYNHMDSATNKIDDAWMDRVEEVVNYVLDNDMYCILNVHHDTGEKGWLRAAPKDLEKNKAKFQSIWEQISERFADYGDKLLFEGFNEILDTNNNWTSPNADSLKITNELNQLFVDTVRASGRKNATRCLILNTYCASAVRAIVSGFTLPTDTVKDKLIVSAHIYQPYYFTSEVSPETTTWGTGKSTLESYIQNMNKYFVEKGIPVIIGEFGAVDKNNRFERQGWLRFYVDTCTKYGIKCFWWDNGNEYKIFNRKTMQPSEAELIDIMLTEAKGGNYELDRTLYGDADGNGVVNSEDLAMLQSYLKGDTANIENCDMNKDGVTDAADEEILAGQLEEAANMCSNPNNWANWINTGNGAVAQMTHLDKGAMLTAEKSGKNTWDVQISYTKLNLEQGSSYKVSFDYSGSPAQSMSFHIMQDYGNYETYFTDTLNYQEAAQHYETIFTMTKASDNYARITFDCGASKLNTPFTITIENLKIIKQ